MIEQMVSFIAVVDAGGFSEAGRRLGFPKSTLSERVRQLEERLGVRLLQRTPRIVRLTDEGRAYYERCVHIIAEIEEAELAIRQEPAAPTGTLRLSVPIEFGMQILSHLLTQFLTAHPHIKMKVELTSRNVDLIEEGFDLALRIGTLDDSSLVARRILGIPRSLYASPAYLAIHGRPTSPDALAGHACLRFETAFYHGAWVLRGPDGRVSFQPNGRMIGNNLSVLRDAAIAGIGIALLPRYQCRAAEREGALERVLPDWAAEDAEVYILYPSKRQLSSRVRAFLRFLDRHKSQLSDSVLATKAGGTEQG